MKHRLPLILGALFLCVFLSIFNEVLLSPFYPQFFRKVFGVTDLAYTGYYIFICRLTIVLSAPVWGVLSRRFEVKHLLCVGQLGTAVMTALMGTSTSAEQFLVYTILLLLCKSSYLLVYPLIIQLAGEEKRSAIAGTYQAVFHGAIVIATIVGAWMVNIDTPLILFYGIAAADILQLAICVYILQGVSTQRQEEAGEQGAGSRGAGSREQGAGGQGAGGRVQGAGGANQIGYIITIGIVILTFQLANNLVRPYFTKYVTSDPFNVNLLTSSLLFLIPSIMAIAALPYIRQACRPERVNTIYLGSLSLLIISLGLQGFSSQLPLLILARIVYGFFLAVTQATLELQLFNNSAAKHLHLNYSLVISFANIGHLGAPLLASWLVNTHSLASPFIAATAICCLNLLFTHYILNTKTRKQAAGTS
ncbi:MFS transporter [Nodularia harveyana UHCC-0300]|uniref:MFS transporter n=1 Tax=Nodularia harveyana UHCC-0300 TaxID=2974287 RepID=A0ABU5UJF0_9CYAN|nr:MFS transporter [Nodularia harveyana]MEA5583645.1 MFS transporter [Nodularia harveyana UHCC-0300]